MFILVNDWIIACAVFYQLALPKPPMTRNAEIEKSNPESHYTDAARRADAATRDGDRATQAASAPSGGFPGIAASASVLLHAVVIAILASTQLRPVPPTPEAPTITMRLIPAPATEARSSADEDQAPDAMAETEPQAQPPTGDSSGDDPATIDTPTVSQIIEKQDPARAGTLRATVLEQVRAQPVESGRDIGAGLPWAPSGAPAPGVPGVRGWISAHVGEVATSAQTWRDNDGSNRGRYVLASGTVICTRRRAPTIDELMNPWKSIAVTLGSICGRERPDAPDFSDPRVQPPPSAVRRPADD